MMGWIANWYRSGSGTGQTIYISGEVSIALDDPQEVGISIESEDLEIAIESTDYDLTITSPSFVEISIDGTEVNTGY